MTDKLAYSHTTIPSEQLILPRLTRAEVPRVALLVETSREVGRSILRGIERYARLNGPWSFHLLPGDLIQQLPEVKSWGGTGIIARIETPEVERAIIASGLPLVALDLYENQKSKGGPFENCSEVHVDSYAVGQMAADHLMERRFENYAFVGEINDVLWSKERENGFRDRLSSAGFQYERYIPKKNSRNWGLELPRLGKWLQELPKPIGLMAAMDVRGRQVIAACQEFNIRVPDEVAVLGVDNDTLLCQLCTPPMSSIALDSENGGFQAAAILDAMMNGQCSSKCVYKTAPLSVVCRQSTERFEIDDEMVADAMKFIWINPMASLSVKEIANHLAVSRRVLEVRFRKTLGHSVLTEINNARIKRIKQLLKETDLKVHQIAELCGFSAEGYLCRFFQRLTGETLGQYRKRALEARRPTQM